jgi:hypothetical protein
MDGKPRRRHAQRRSQQEKDGGMRLTAVEYIVPLGAWSAPKPPRLFHHDFAVNPTFGVWALHAWAWGNNPGGMFADWNPNVSCDNAPASR